MRVDALSLQLFTLLAVGACLVFLRIYARISVVGIRNFALDDYLMLFALAVYGLETGAAYSVGAVYHGLANNDMTPTQRASLAPDSEEYRLRVGGSKLQLMGWSSYTLLLWLLKTCICIFYTRIASGIPYMRIRIQIGFAIIAATYIATISSILGGCGTAFSKNWQINPDPGNACQPAVSRIDLFVTLVLNVTSDLYLMSIPISMLWKVQVSAPRKLGLLFLFSLGIFVTIAGILRCWYVLNAGPNGAQQAGSWAVYETFVAVTVGNLPLIAPLFTRAVQVVSIKLSTAGDSSGGNTRGGAAGGTECREAVLDSGIRTKQDADPESEISLSSESHLHSGIPDRNAINVTTWVAVDFEEISETRRPKS